MIEIAPAAGVPRPAIVAIWNGACGGRFPMTERLLAQVLDADPYYESEGSLVALDGAKPVGWVLCKSMNRNLGLAAFGGPGGIGALCVIPEYQRRGIGSQLLDRAEQHLKREGSALTTRYFPHHLLPGVPAEAETALRLLRGRGYEDWHESVDLWRDLHDFEVPRKVRMALERNPTVEIRPAGPDDQEGVLAMVAREFPGGWTYSTRRHFAGGGAASDIIIAVEAGAVIGFCHTADWRSSWLLPSVYWHPLMGEKYGGLGPVGISQEHRKRGLGLALTALAVADLKRRGVTQMAIDWTSLITFYEQLGFKVWKRYLHGQKP